jgi:DNA-directed RNA polymerase specialized sigma24 family protein
MTDQPIDHLLVRFEAGDEAAAGDLYRTFEPFLRGLVRRRLPGRARGRFDSADVVQSAWASLLDGLRDARWRFPDAAHLRAFLARVVLCRLYDRAEPALAQIGREEPLAAAGRDLAGPEPRPSEYARAGAAWDRLLAACPPEYLPVLHLRRAGHTCAEIADEIGMHPGSVRRVLRELARRVAFDDN